MRTHSSNLILFLSLLSACGAGDDPEPTSAGTLTGSTSDAGTTTGPTTGSGTTELGTTTGPDGTTDAGSATGSSSSTGPDGTTEPDSTTTDTGTTGEPPGTDVPYVDCSADPENPLPCPEGLMCADPYSTNGLFFGAFCAPECVGDFMECPMPDGAVGVYATCLLGQGMATHCVLTCNLADDTCPGGMQCEDVGLADGVCTHP